MIAPDLAAIPGFLTDLPRVEEIGTTHEQVRDAKTILRRAGEAMERDARLLSLVASTLPQWRGSGLTLGQALRRYWPRGRAA